MSESPAAVAANPVEAAAPPEKAHRKFRVPPALRPYTDFGLYLIIRFWAFLMECFSVDANLVTARWLGRIWWRIHRRHRMLSLKHLRASFGRQYTRAEITRIARKSFEHWAQVYLVEIIMSPRLLNRYSWPRYVELGDLSPALRELLQGRSAIMVTAHFGNFELLGFTLSRLGIPITAVMRPVDNKRLNRVLVKKRADSGMTLLDKWQVAEKAEEILESGEPLCFIADQDAGPKQYFVPFFGRPAATYKSIGLLAVAHNLTVIVGYAARTRKGFHYRIELEQIIRPEEWQDKPNPPLWVTEQYSAAMERSIRKHPEQYLWVHRRWKTQPGAKRKKR
jgi:KDO2-lipid IV(A) lauroyltransferase